MKLSSKSAMLKNHAKACLEGKYYVTIMALVFFNMMSFLLTSFSSSISIQVTATLKRMFDLEQSGTALAVTSYLILFLFTALCNVFRIGICLFFLNIACNQYYNTFDLFYGFTQGFGKSYLLSGILTLMSTLVLSPVDALVFLYRQNNGIRVDVLELLILIQVVLLVVYLPLSLALSQCYFIMLDYPDLSISDIIKQSVKIMKGRKLQLFYLQVSFLPLYLLTIPTFGLGALWLAPYTNMTYTLFFLDTMKGEQ